MAGQGPIKIVIADDAEDIRTLIRMQLERDGRFEVSGEAVDAPEAVALLKEHRPHLATFDLHMPGMEELAGLHEARAASPETEILIITGTYHPTRDPDLEGLDIAGWTTKDQIMVKLAERLAAIASPQHRD